MRTINIGFTGIGLIGGSIARGLKEIKILNGEEVNINIKAYNRSKDNLKAAKDAGVVDEMIDELNEEGLKALGLCDYIFLCAPVKTNNDILEKLVPYISEDTIITDVGSVKGPIHKKAGELKIEDKVIGGHPMAGSEKTGFLNSKDNLLENAYYILTPGKGVIEDRVNELKEMVLSLKAIPIIVPPEKHDRITAAVSHLPHVIAASLVNFVKDEDTDGMMKRIAAGGFKDITRISSSSPEMWQSICMTNKDNILSMLDDYEDMLIRARSIVENEDDQSIYRFFESAKNYRDSFIDVSSGPIKKSFVLSLDVKDESGVIARTATVLADKDINIKNIGIVHNRESGEGALKIAFYDEASLESARDVLIKNGFTIVG